MNAFRDLVRALLGASVLALTSCGYGLFPEASFPLAAGCRLPRWFQLPEGVSRTSVTLQMDAYLPQFVFTLSNMRGEKIATVTGKRKGNYPISLTDQAGHRASYEVIYVGSLGEAIVYKYGDAGPSFCPVDDPYILKALGL